MWHAKLQVSKSSQLTSPQRRSCFASFRVPVSSRLACERRRIFSVTGSAENNVCELELENDFCDVTTFVFSLANHIAW